MCKCCQSCIETVWWHLIEKRFCYDESIALYEVPEKPEKNNNIFENMAFYDSVSIIAGRAVVTIEPILQKKKSMLPIVQQPKHGENGIPDFRLFIEPPPNNVNVSINKNLSKSAPDILDNEESNNRINMAEKVQLTPAKLQPKKVVMPKLGNAKSEIELSKSEMESRSNNSLEIVKSAEQLCIPSHSNEASPELRKRSLFERRLSRNAYLMKIECVGDQCREVPIIRQNSMPKFYLGSPEDHQIETSIFRTPSAALTSPVPATKHGFVYDLSSVVQIENERAMLNDSPINTHTHEKGGKTHTQFRDKIVKLRRIKSTMSAFQINHI